MNNSFDITKIKSWKIYKDFKHWSNGYSDKTIATASISMIVVIGFVALISFIPKRKPKRILINKNKLKHFIPTTEWKAVEADHICPPGLQYKIDLSTGIKLAKKITN